MLRDSGRSQVFEERRSSPQVIHLANSIFQQLLESNTSERTQLEQLASDLIMLLPPPAEQGKSGQPVNQSMSYSHHRYLKPSSCSLNMQANLA